VLSVEATQVIRHVEVELGSKPLASRRIACQNTQSLDRSEHPLSSVISLDVAANRSEKPVSQRGLLIEQQQLRWQVRVFLKVLVFSTRWTGFVEGFEQLHASCRRLIDFYRSSCSCFYFGQKST